MRQLWVMAYVNVFAWWIANMATRERDDSMQAVNEKTYVTNVMRIQDLTLWTFHARLKSAVRPLFNNHYLDASCTTQENIDGDTAACEHIENVTVETRPQKCSGILCHYNWAKTPDYCTKWCGVVHSGLYSNEQHAKSLKDYNPYSVSCSLCIWSQNILIK